MEFSPDNNLILVVMAKRSIAEVFYVKNGQRVCNIVEEACGLVHARFSPDSRQVITFSDYQIKATIYNLAEKTQHQIKSPKYPNKGNKKFLKKK